jgi:hypothetical protein
MNLLTRDEFRDAVFARDNHKCVICGCTEELVAHHIIERRLWDDSGYYLDNGVTLCSKHHIEAEKTLLGCDEIRSRSGITKILLPNTFDKDEIFDKWGNIILASGMRVKGELFWDESVNRILEEVKDKFTDYVKYPKTYHLPWSMGIDTKTDRVLTEEQLGENFEGKEIVVTEKLDGENTNCYPNYLHARSLDGRNHVSRNWMKKCHSQWSYNIPEKWRVCGENVTAVHSIKYFGLPTYFFVFGIYNEKNICLSWDNTLEYCDLLGLKNVPVLYKGIYDIEKVKSCYTGKSFFGNSEQEGYVIRLASEIPWSRHKYSIAKNVRKDHVQTSQNWMNRAVEYNELEK